MDISHDGVADAIYIRFSREPVYDSDEVASGIIVDYNNAGEILGIEVLNFSKRSIDLNRIILLNPDELVPAIVQCL
jgi:uncharacterized protein YuzE